MRCKYNVIISLVFLVSLFRVQISVAQDNNEGLGILVENKKWQLLGPSILQEISARFPDRETLCTFMNLSEKYGLLQNNYKKAASNMLSSEASMIVSTVDSFASALTSAANDFGGNGKIDESLELLRLALIIRPAHWPAQMSMATCYFVNGDCMNSLKWCDIAEQTVDRLLRTPDKNLSSFQQDSKGMATSGIGRKLSRQLIYDIIRANCK